MYVLVPHPHDEVYKNGNSPRLSVRWLGPVTVLGKVPRNSKSVNYMRRVFLLREHIILFLFFFSPACTEEYHLQEPPERSIDSTGVKKWRAW